MPGDIERTAFENHNIFRAVQHIAIAEMIANGITLGEPPLINFPVIEALEHLDAALETLRLVPRTEIPQARALEMMGDLVDGNEVRGSHRPGHLEYYQRALGVLQSVPDLALVTEPIIRITQKIYRVPKPT